MSSRPSKSDVRNIGGYLKENKRTLEAVNKVKQTGVGFKIQNGKIMTDTVAMIFFVRFKPKINALRRLNIEPLPKEIDGIPTDVIEVPTGFATRIVRQNLRIATPDDSRYRPIPGGVAMINAREPATGTLGLIVQKRKTNEYFACTNNHVGANEDVEGLPPLAQKGDPWIQPGAHGNGHAPQDTFATLERWGRMNTVLENHYDFSIGKVIDGADVRPYYMQEVGEISGIADIELGDIVLKRGRTTRLRRGMVTAVGINDVQVSYQGRPCPFDDQVAIVGTPESLPFSLAGDSGSFVVSEESPHAVKAQLFAGGEDNEGIDITIASPIRKIIGDFDVDL